MKGTDTKYATDQAQMKNINIWTTGENYWLASRESDWDDYNCDFNVRDATFSRGGYYPLLCHIGSNGSSHGYSFTIGLRPCFSLRSDINITGGNGTSDSPYTM